MTLRNCSGTHPLKWGYENSNFWDMSSSDKNILTQYQENLCEYGGTFGVLITLTTMIQHIIAVISNWLTQSMLVVYVFALTSFFLLVFKKAIAPYLLIASTVLAVSVVFIWSKYHAFSLMVVVFALYHMIIVAVIFIDGIPGKLKERLLAEKAERDAWAGKI